jgi:hypothetical protein
MNGPVGSLPAPILPIIPVSVYVGPQGIAATRQPIPSGTAFERDPLIAIYAQESVCLIYFSVTVL